MRGGIFSVVLLACCLPGRTLLADDADMIPDAVLAPTQDAPPERGTDRSLSAKAFVEAATQDIGWRATTPPVPGLDTSRYQGWTSFDLNAKYRVSDTVSLALSDRLDQSYEDSHTPTTNMARNSLREAYADWTPDEGWFFDLGRVNTRDGVAQAFNPTDFLKTQAVVLRQNLDPDALRTNRLGTVMARAQTVSDAGSITVLAAPRLTFSHGPLENQVFLADFDRTNADWRFLAKASLHTQTALVPEILAYTEGHGSPRFGVNLSQGIGDRIVVWNEWSGGRQANLVQSAITYAVSNGILPQGSPTPIAVDPTQTFQTQNAMGASLSFESKLTLSLEWHYNQRGLTASQWRDWFKTGRSFPALAAALWEVRAYAQAMGEPMGRNEVYGRADWTDFPIRDMTTRAFALLDPTDGSLFGQVSAEYFLSPKVTTGLRATLAPGSGSSQWGTLPEAWALLGHVVVYF